LIVTTDRGSSDKFYNVDFPGLTTADPGGSEVVYNVDFYELTTVGLGEPVRHRRNVDEAMPNLGSFPAATNLSVWTGFKITDHGLLMLKNAQRLRNLHLEGSPVTDESLRVLKDKKNLRSLVLSDSGVTGLGLRYLYQCDKLETLGLDKCKLDEHIGDYLGGLKHLKSLRVVEASFSPKAWLLGVHAPELVGLDMSSTTVTNKQVAAIVTARTLLENLNLNGCKQLNDEVVTSLVSLKKLKFLSVTNTGITKEGVAKIKESLKGCLVSHTQ
jgi:hypothetical protein